MANNFFLLVLVSVSIWGLSVGLNRDNDDGFLYENWHNTKSYQEAPQKELRELPTETDPSSINSEHISAEYNEDDVTKLLLPSFLRHTTRHSPETTAWQLRQTTTPATSTTTMSDDIKRCIRGCPNTPEYNPVCGSNRVSYYNPGTLYCAQVCGVVVKLVRTGKCNGKDRVFP